MEITTLEECRKATFNNLMKDTNVFNLYHNEIFPEILNAIDKGEDSVNLTYEIKDESDEETIKKVKRAFLLKGFKFTTTHFKEWENVCVFTISWGGVEHETSI